MNKPIKVVGQSDPVEVPVHRRNTTQTENVSISLPKELAQKINGIVVETKQSRSLVIAELLQKAFNE